MNILKCESILFRPSLTKVNRVTKKTYKLFKLKDTETNEDIPHKNIKYLGVDIDEKLLFKKHLQIQLDKARVAFMKYKLFYFKHLHSKTKLICYCFGL